MNTLVPHPHACSWPSNALTTRKHFLSAPPSTIASCPPKHPAHNYSLWSSQHVDWTWSSSSFQSQGHSSQRRVWVIHSTGSTSTRKMPQTQTFWLSIQSSFQTTCYCRWKQILLWAWQSLLLWGLTFFFSSIDTGWLFAKANEVY